MSATERMPADQIRAAASLGFVFGVRMYGLFLVLPVLAVLGTQMPGATAITVGLAVGAYGLTQALLQIPLGLAADRWGRHRIITLGLLLFIAGSVVAALADSIWWVIAGRALQGCGAIAAAVMALLADSTGEHHRSKAMAVLGIGVGGSFLLALMTGPLLVGPLGLSGLFWLTAILGGVALALVPKLPTPTGPRTPGAQPSRLPEVLRNPYLLRLDLGMLVLHATLTSMFVAVPGLLVSEFGMPATAHWQVYLPVLLISVVAMAPVLVIASRRERQHWLPPLGMVVLAVALAGLAVTNGAAWIILLVLFFIAFNLMEASMPAQVSRRAPETARATALGVFSTSQFAGAFLGGSLGGVLVHFWGESAVFVAGAVVALVCAVLVVPPAEGSRAGPLPDSAG